MNKRGPTILGASVVDLTRTPTRRMSDIPTHLVSARKRYPAQAPSRVFATPHQGVDASHLTLLSRGQLFLARVVAGLLIPLILIHPFARVYADETSPPVESVAPTPSPEEASAPEVASPSTSAPAPVDELPTPLPPDVSTEEVIPATLENAPEGETTTPTQDEEPLPVPVVDSSENETAIETPIEDEANAESTPPAPPDTTSGVENVSSGGFGSGSTSDGGAVSDVSTTTEHAVDDVSTSTEEILIDDIARSSPESSPEATLETPEEEQPSEGDNAPVTTEDPPLPLTIDNDLAPSEEVRMERLRNELRREVEQEFLRGCISFETSGYYCLNDGARKPTASTTSKVSTTVESVQGAGGDKEIFVVRDGVRIPLTDNDWDDAFPTQDTSGEQFVWQGMKGGRWQIFMGTLSASGTVSVTQVTDSRESNFNPKIDGDHIVWQGFVDENWEIFMATKRDANSPLAEEHLPEGNALLNVSNDFAVLRLTKNEEHDMFPSLHGDIATWQTRAGADWVVNAYSIGAKSVTQLSSDGAKGENPRFALTWEERDQDGNARLVGYDLATGEKTDITSASRQLPPSPYGKEDTMPLAPSDPIALPSSGGTGSSTAPRGEDDSNDDNPLLP